MVNKKVSAIIPFYNGAEWLCESVQSVLDQSYKNIEIIVVNDGSPENVDYFLNKYSDKIIYHYQENLGPAAARNKAMELATGDIFAFLDSDDLWLPQKVELQLKLMEKTGAMWSHHGFKYFWPSGKEKIVNNHEDYGNIYGKIDFSIGIGTLCVMINRKIFEEHPDFIFPIEMRKAQDIWVWKHIAEFYPIALLDEVLGKVRMRGTNSNTRAILRFNLQATKYKQSKYEKSMPFVVRLSGKIYSFYSNIFGTKETPFKEFIAKCFWSIPFLLNRLGLKMWLNKNPRDHRYRLKAEEL